MTMFRRLLAIATRSFYRNNRHSKHLNRCNYSTKAHHYKLYPTSTRSLSYHYRKYTTTTTNTKAPPSVIVEAKNPSNSSFKKRFIFIAAVTTLSYLGYKYYFYDKTDENESLPADKNNKSVSRAIYKTATDIIENTIINTNSAFKMGLFMDNRKQYEKALYFYKLYLRKPNNKTGEYAALNNISILYYKLNQYDNALIAFELLGDQQITERNLEFLRAHCYQSTKQYPLALKYYLKFLNNRRSEKPDIMAAYNNIALLYYEMGNFNKALEYFSKIGDDIIKEKNYGFRVAHALQNTNQFERSLKYYNLYLENENTTNTNLMNTYHNLGILFYENGKEEQAMDMFNKLGEEELKKRNLEFKMAHLCAKLGDHKGAIKYLNDCRNKPEIYGEYAVICQGIIAQILYEMEDYEQAIHEFDLLGKDQIIQQDLYFPAAYSYFKCGQYEKALTFYYLLLQHSNDKLTKEEIAYVYSRICLIYYKQKQYKKALEMIEKQLPDTFIHDYNLEFIVAHSNHKFGRFDKAETYYHRFLENKQSDQIDVVNCYQNLALLYYDLNNFTKCIEYFGQINEDMIVERGLEFYMAHGLQELKRHKECIKYYQIFLDKIEAKSDEEINENELLNKLNVYHNLGSVYYTLEQWQNACDMWSQLNDNEIEKRNLALKLSKCYDMVNDNNNKSKYLQLAGEVYDKENMDKINLAKMYYNMYQNQMAIHIFSEISTDEIIKHNAEFVVAHCYQLIGDTENAIKYYRMGLDNENKEIKYNTDEINNGYHNLGCAYYDSGQYKHAIQCFDKLSREHIIKTNMEFIIGVAYQNLSEANNALKYYKMFLQNGQIKENNMLACYNNMVILYYYHFKDYFNAWDILQKMGEQNIKEKKLEFESAHCAQKLNKNKISFKYYRSFLSNTPKNELSDEIANSIYNNIKIMYQNDKSFDQNTFDEFKRKSGNNKQKELQLFLQWINNTNI